MQMAPNGRVFFIDHTSKTTSWVDPRTGCASPMPNAAQNYDKHEDELGPLPEGWEERVHSDGRIFFIDHNTRTVYKIHDHVLLILFDFRFSNMPNRLNGKIQDFQIQQSLDKRCHIRVITNRNMNISKVN